MLRKSVVVFGLFFAMLLASPAGAQRNDDDSDTRQRSRLFGAGPLRSGR